MLTATGHYDDALRHAALAVDIFRQLDADRPERPSQGLAAALLSLSEGQARLGSAALALSAAQEAVAVRRLHAGTGSTPAQAPSRQPCPSSPLGWRRTANGRWPVRTGRKPSSCISA
jgi:hypothetical protein